MAGWSGTSESKWLFLDSGDTVSQTDHPVAVVLLLFCLFVVIKHVYDII